MLQSPLLLRKWGLRVHIRQMKRGGVHLIRMVKDDTGWKQQVVQKLRTFNADAVDWPLLEKHEADQVRDALAEQKAQIVRERQDVSLPSALLQLEQLRGWLARAAQDPVRTRGSLPDWCPAEAAQVLDAIEGRFFDEIRAVKKLAKEARAALGKAQAEAGG